MHFAFEGWEILSVLLLLVLGVPSRFRDWAIAATRLRWLQGLIFLSLLTVAVVLLQLPVRMYSQHVSVAYGLSVQGWRSWFSDQSKSLLLTVINSYIAGMALFIVIRRSPRRWWFWYWALSAPYILFSIFIWPVLIAPIFNHFQPLQESNPALVAQLERVVQRSGTAIPPERMFLMAASEKSTGLNAYVTGIGSSKRIVVWDTTVARSTPDEIAFTFGHEMGHYVLHHIFIGLGLTILLQFLLFWIGYYMVHWLIARFGAAWRIPAVEDWAVLAVFVLLMYVFLLFTEPLTNGVSRMIEHNADVYGQEAIHGIVADPQQTAMQDFQLIGASVLADPTPHPFMEFWVYDHPPTWRRFAFARDYNPWALGGHPKYFSK